KVGQVEVYKVHHHCSAYSSNPFWLSTIKPVIGIVSAGNGNDYGHPTEKCLNALHQAGVKTYWTEEGAGADPDPRYDVVGGNILVEVAPGAKTFTVTHNGGIMETYNIWGSVPNANVAPAPAQQTYVWSDKSDVYHFANCRYA